MQHLSWLEKSWTTIQIFLPFEIWSMSKYRFNNAPLCSTEETKLILKRKLTHIVFSRVVHAKSLSVFVTLQLYYICYLILFEVIAILLNCIHVYSPTSITSIFVIRWQWHLWKASTDQFSNNSRFKNAVFINKLCLMYCY